jgi:sigma-B regulation protein RsbU (phosphoserine phosphatase)
VRADGRVRRLGGGGLPVGALAGARYSTTGFEIENGERLVLHSDGVVDCVNEAGDPFGQQRFDTALATGAARGLADCLRSVGLALDHWRGTAALDDDVSILMLEPGVVT